MKHRKILVENGEGIVIDTETGKVGQQEQSLRQIRYVIVLQTERLHVVADSDGLRDGADAIEARVEVMKILQRAELLGQVGERVVRHDESLEGRQRQHLRG